MDAIATFLQQFDDAWGHDYESLTAALEGVGEEEAAWQAPCYRGVEREEGWPEPGTIRWHVVHVAHCKRDYTTLIRARGGDPPGAPAPPPVTAGFADDRAGLEAAHAGQRRAIAELTVADLDARVGNGMPLHEFLAMVVRHDIWHAAQIAVARRLWSTR